MFLCIIMTHACFSYKGMDTLDKLMIPIDCGTNVSGS
jgi:hypothetical protein